MAHVPGKPLLKDPLSIELPSLLAESDSDEFARANVVFRMAKELIILTQESIARIYDHVMVKNSVDEIVDIGRGSWSNRIREEQIVKRVEEVRDIVLRSKVRYFLQVVEKIVCSLSESSTYGDVDYSAKDPNLECIAEDFGKRTKEICVSFVEKSHPGTELALPLVRELNGWCGKYAKSEVDFIMTSIYKRWEGEMRHHHLDMEGMTHIKDRSPSELFNDFCYPRFNTRALRFRYSLKNDHCTRHEEEHVKSLQDLVGGLYAFCTDTMEEKLRKLEGECKESRDDESNALELAIVNNPLEQQDDMDQGR